MIDRRRLINLGISSASGSALFAPLRHAFRPTVMPYLWNVCDFGALGDGRYVNTKELQATIDACSQSGGGTVFFPNGNFLIGTITLKDNVLLHLSPGATLEGSQNPKDYPVKPFPARDLDIGGFGIWALVYADGAQNIGIEGMGTINGNGRPFPPQPHGKNRDVPTSFRPRLLFLKNCLGLTLSGVTLRDSACWTAHFALCQKIFVHGISIYSNFFYNQDGIVLDSCRDAMVSNCYVDASDDAIVIKSSFPQPSQNITITNCILTTTCAAIKFGSQSLGGFKNVSISNCVCYECALGGIKFESVDGGDLEDVTVSNLTMHNVSAPITVILGNRAEDFGFNEVTHPRSISRLRNVIITGIRATVEARNGTWRRGNTCLITGQPGHPVEDLLIENVSLTYPGE